jgi:hypothetical protein
MKKNDKYSSEDGTDKHLRAYEMLNDEEKESVIMNPGHVDESKWKKAKEAIHKEYGEYKWPAVMYVYEKMGGKT